MNLILDSKALERLIGGDTELEVKIRTSVANQFAGKFLKSLVNSELMRNDARQIELIITEELYGKHGALGRQILPKYKMMITGLVAEAISGQIQEEINRLIDGNEYKKQLDVIVQNAAQKIANQFTKENIEARIEAAADKKIKQKLGL